VCHHDINRLHRLGQSSQSLFGRRTVAGFYLGDTVDPGRPGIPGNSQLEADANIPARSRNETLAIDSVDRPAQL